MSAPKGHTVLLNHNPFDGLEPPETSVNIRSELHCLQPYIAVRYLVRSTPSEIRQTVLFNLSFDLEVLRFRLLSKLCQLFKRRLPKMSHQYYYQPNYNEPHIDEGSKESSLKYLLPQNPSKILLQCTDSQIIELPEAKPGHQRRRLLRTGDCCDTATGHQR